ncbi:MAG: hypothetical protein FWC33_00995 [Candidatus Bathyarchaeota archaeon]|nr:hypothetical protein [Candidatus Termiticorpusculum sp.]
MSKPENNTTYIKCPYCACIFFTQTDLDIHIKKFGNNPTQHAKDYKETNAKIEYGYGNDE